MVGSLLNGAAIEEREENMISPTGGLSTRRKAYFLKPTVNSIEGPSLKLPSLTPKPKWPLQVAFNGWRDPLRKWKTWVENMHSKYSSVWKEAGIYEAVMGSFCKIHKDDDFVFGFAERWVSDTNTFIFPWGEATITLEDMLILGGFSVLGDDPVLLPLETEELVKIERFLENSRERFAKTKTDSHSHWLNVFMDSGSKFEHEAFLSLWLSRFVFPGNHLDRIGDHVFCIAIHLARGRRLAVGPAVLASIYRDLGLLREAMAASTKLSEDGSYLYLTLWSPLQFVQVWAWERLRPLQPEPNFIGSGMVRIARWSGPKKSEIGNVRPGIDSAGVSFLWRPYAICVDDWSFPMFYDKEEKLIKCEDLSIELESFARCLRACQLVGIDCQEPYNPHRVAMQFGFDQDFPGWISRENTSPGIAWCHYSKSFSDDEMLYLPSRLSESDVTTRYLEWWRKTVLCPVNPIKGMVKGRRSSRKRLKCPRSWRKTVLSNGKYKRKLSPECLQKLITLKTVNDPEVPPGFQPICNRARVNQSSMSILQPCGVMRNKEKNSSRDGKVLPNPDSQCLLSENVGSRTMKQSVINLDEDGIQNEAVTCMEMQRMVNLEKDKVKSTMILEQSQESNPEKLSYDDFANFNLEAVSALEARILRLGSELIGLKN